MGAVRRLSDEFDIYSSSRGTVILSRVWSRAGTDEELFKVGSICLAMKGETVAGDCWCTDLQKDSLRTIVADGLGHGVAAHDAAAEAIRIFSEQSSLSLNDLMMRIHAGLKSTRGAAVFLLNLSRSGVDFLGVGNIRALMFGPSTIMKSLISNNGTAGVQIRSCRFLSQSWDGMNLLVLHSDGIQNRWDLNDYPGLKVRHPALIAAILNRDFSRGTDDSSVVVIRRLD
jgi:hypothetical protein